MGNFKVRCKYSSGKFTVGGVYDIKDGSLTNDEGQVFDRGSRGFGNIDQLNTWMCSKFELAEEIKGFTLSDLKPCMVVKIRDGRLALVVERKDGLALSELSDLTRGLIGLKRFDNTLLVAKEKNSDYDIMIVYDFSDSCDIASIKDRKLLYKRIEKSPTQIKLEELESKQREMADEMAQLRKEME